MSPPKKIVNAICEKDENEIDDLISYDAVEIKQERSSNKKSLYLQATPEFKAAADLRSTIGMSNTKRKEETPGVTTKSEQMSQNQSNMDSSGNIGPHVQPVSDRDAKTSEKFYSDILASQHEGDSSQFMIDEKQKFDSFPEDISFEPVLTGEEE